MHVLHWFGMAALLSTLSWMPQTAQAQSLPLRFDPALSTANVEAINSDIAQLDQAALHGESIKAFQEIFGGTGGPDVFSYLGQRVTTIVAAGTDLGSRVTPIGDTAPGTGPGEPIQVAANVGTGIFFAVVKAGVSGAQLSLDGSNVDIFSTRAGIIQLGKDYLNLPSILRISALVHEARHSDCTGGLTDAQKASIRAGGDTANFTCGHAHVICPSGTYKGLPACDGHPWGAYSAQAVFDAAVSQTCDNCAAEAKQTADALAVDAISRYPDFERMINGELGPPDMNQTEVPLP